MGLARWVDDLERHLRLRDPLFQIGLAIRLSLVLLVVPATYGHWFLPFLQNSIAAGAMLDPWAAHQATGLDSHAFPYGVSMYLVLLPLTAIGAMIDGLGGSQAAGAIGLGLTILVLDLTMLAVLQRLRPERPRRLLLLYWLSPIVLFIGYWHGQLDLVPLLLLVLAVLSIRQHLPASAGALMGAAIAAKLSMLIASPLLMIYLIVNKRLRPLLLPFCTAMVGIAAVLQFPLLISPAARSMVLGTPEMDKVYDLAISSSGGLEIYLLLVVYILLMFGAWSIRRISFDLLIALIAIGFLVTVLMTPASPGWFLWPMPFVALIFATARLQTTLIVMLFGFIFAGFHLMRSSGAEVPMLGLDLTLPWADTLGLTERELSIWLSLLVAAGIVTSALLLREGIWRNDYFRISRRPILIGIAGDSGSGKDTLADAMIGLMGRESVAHVSGDDYHHWDRSKPMWQVLTHLNPNANDLYQYQQDVLSLAGGQSILSRHYDHETGRKSKPRRQSSNDVIIASGLHALYHPAVAERCDVRIFLDMDDKLRRHFKIRRDVHERRHKQENVLASFDRRQPDRENFILPQSENADLVFSLRPLHPALLEDASHQDDLPRLKLCARLRRGTPYEQLVRILIGVCGLHVEVVLSHFGGPIDVTLEGDVEPEDVQMAAWELIPNLDDLVTLKPTWQGGTNGLMQLLVLNQTAYALRNRLA
ncbi:MAG: hypothetical protein AAF543_03175 [Pseudomonadota bacterium]